MAAKVGVLGDMRYVVAQIASICLICGLATGSIAYDAEAGVEVRIAAGTTELRAVLYDNPCALEFAGLLPLRLTVFDRIGLVKTAILPHTISGIGERTREYAPGAIFYWPGGPEVAFCYSGHLPETVVDIIHIGKLESNPEFFRSYTGELLIEAVK